MIKAAKSVKQVPTSTRNEKLDKSWLGSRQTVELPFVPTNLPPKTIEPELLNRKFFWVEDYFHYNDWKSELEQTYDQFNLLQMPFNKHEIKLFFDEANHNRRVPKGIFPHPNQKRVVMEQN